MVKKENIPPKAYQDASDCFGQSSQSVLHGMVCDVTIFVDLERNLGFLVINS